MKRQTKIILIVCLLVLFLLAWAPWITDEYAKNKFVLDACFIEAHAPGSRQENPEIGVMWLPFFRFAATYDCGVFVTFWGQKLP